MSLVIFKVAESLEPLSFSRGHNFDKMHYRCDRLATRKRTQQLPTLLAQQCWEMLPLCWQWCAQTDATTPNNM